MPLFGGGDELGLARTWRLRSEVGRLVCRFAEEEAALEHALAHADAARDERETAEIKLGLGNCFCWGPMPVDEAIARCQTMLDEARGVRWVEASTLGMLAYLLALADRAAAPAPRRSRAIYEELGMSFALAARAVIPAGIELMAGDLEAAEHALRGTRPARGDRRERAPLHDRGHPRQVLYEQGRDDEAESFARASERAAAEEDLGSQVLWRSALAKVLARRDGAATRATGGRGG